MKTIFLSGRLVADPEIKPVGDNNAKIAKFTIANNEGGPDSAEFYDVHCWDSMAELVGNNLKKGSRVVVQGTFSNSPYTDKDGKKRVHFDVNAYKVEFVS